MSPAVERRSRSARRWLRIAAIAAAATLLLHGVDHVRRGFDVVTPEVFVAANVQAAYVLACAWLAVRRHPWAPSVAVAVGIGNILGVSVSHFLPQWSALSDSFVGHGAPGVTAFTWATALAEVAADALLAAAGIWVLRTRRRSRLTRAIS